MSSFTHGSSNYAEVAHDIWSPSKEISDQLRDLIPSEQDLLDEIRRYQMPGVELMPADFTGRRLRLKDGDENIREYVRDKFYVRVFVDHEAVIARDVDAIRHACFEGARLIGQHISMRVMDAIEATRPKGPLSATFVKAQAEWYRAPMTVRFTGKPMNLLQRLAHDGSFVCLDPVSDRVAFHFCSYFTVAPVGEAVADE